MRQQEKAKINEARRPARILVVEDEPNMVAGLRDNFEFGPIVGLSVETAREVGLEESLRWGAACGSLSTRGLGGTARQPSAEEAERLVRPLA